MRRSMFVVQNNMQIIPDNSATKGDGVDFKHAVSLQRGFGMIDMKCFSSLILNFVEFDHSIFFDQDFCHAVHEMMMGRLNRMEGLGNFYMRIIFNDDEISW